jgi:hypothetical protein
MSNALAIATVTQTLVNVVTASLGSARVNGPQVSTLRPDDSSLQGPETTPRVNIFLYQVTPNTAWRNADLPTRRDDGSLVRRPQLALDLHYLFTFYGKDSTLEHQRLLGAVARGLHAQPVLQRADIQSVEQMMDASNSNVLYLDSHLSDQIDLVRITPINFSLDDMSKLWMAFPQTDFVLSVAYMATVVLIETDEPPPASALPVLKWNIDAVPFSLMLIDSVEPQSVVSAPPAPMSINLQGEALGAANSVAFMTPGKSDPIFAPVSPGSTSESNQITLPAGLRPGINTVQLMQTIASPPGSPPSSPIISQSNTMAFVILPIIVDLKPASPPGHLTCVIWPPAGPKQQVSLVLNQQSGPQAFTLPADPHPAETGTFTFSTVFPNGSVPSGTYLVRVQVDSAESRLTVDASGKFNGPTVSV